MGERTAGQSYLNLWNSIQYMVKMSISILLIQWFRKRDTETPYPERSPVICSIKRSSASA